MLENSVVRTDSHEFSYSNRNPLRLDVNECEDDDLNNCDANTNCTNTIGSYYCECENGYKEIDGIKWFIGMDSFNCEGIIHNLLAFPNVKLSI